MDISSYKIDSKEFFVGSSPDKLNQNLCLKFLLDNNVNAIIKICEEDYYDKEVFKKNKIDIIENIQRDGMYPDTENIKLLDEVYNNFIKENKKIFIHCKSGLGRAPTFLGYIIIKYFNKEPYDFINEIRKIRKNSINSAQLQWLIEFNYNKKNLCIIS